MIFTNRYVRKISLFTLIFMCTHKNYACGEKDAVSVDRSSTIAEIVADVHGTLQGTGEITQYTPRDSSYIRYVKEGSFGCQIFVKKTGKTEATEYKAYYVKLGKKPIDLSAIGFDPLALFEQLRMNQETPKSETITVKSARTRVRKMKMKGY